MSKVNRSTYQKAIEENKRLLEDIKLLVEEGIPSAKKILCLAKWRGKFKKEKELDFLIKNSIRNYAEKHGNRLFSKVEK